MGVPPAFPKVRRGRTCLLYTSSDAISTAELEKYNRLHPADIIPKLLLSKKMKQNDAQELMLQFSDRTALHYMSSGSAIPSFRDLPAFLTTGDKNDFSHCTTVSNDLDKKSNTTDAEHQEKLVIEEKVIYETGHLMASDCLLYTSRCV